MRVVFLNIVCLFFISACGIGGTIKLNDVDNMQVNKGGKSLLVADNTTMSDYLWVIPAWWDYFLNRADFIDIESIDGIDLNIDYEMQANKQIIVEPGLHEIAALCTFEIEKENDITGMPFEVVHRAVVTFEFVGGKKYKIYDAGFIGRSFEPECDLNIEEL